MNKHDKKIQARKKWLALYKETGSVSITCRRCGIARSTLYRWIKRYKLTGFPGLSDKSQRPHKFGNQKTTDDLEKTVLKIREKYNWGSQRISNHLNRTHGISISSMTIWRILKRHGSPPLKKLKKSKFKRYSRPVPGDRVQIDVTKIKSAAYQFTAIDDCTRLKVIRIYDRKTAANSIKFLHELLDDFGFPIQRIQTDWGTEFYNYSFQEELHEHFIKFRPIRPRSPYLNGKVERTQQTDKTEFWATIDVKNIGVDLNELAKSWQVFYNKKRPHSSLKGKTPWQKYQSLKHKIPIQPEVTSAFWDSNEKVKSRNSLYQNWLKKDRD